MSKKRRRGVSTIRIVFLAISVLLVVSMILGFAISFIR